MKKTRVLVLVVVLLFAATGQVVWAATPPYWDITGDWTISFVCTSGCSGTYNHTMHVTSFDPATGAFSATGAYIPNTSITWTANGNVFGSDVSLTIDYDGSSYSVDVVATIAGDGTMLGTAVSSTDQEFTWSTTTGEGVCIGPTKAEILKDSGVPGKGLDNAPGLQKPFNPNSKAAEHAGKKK